MRGILIWKHRQGEGGEKSLTQAERKPSPQPNFCVRRFQGVGG